MAVPTYDAMFNPALRALRELGGSATNEELADAVGRIMELSEADIGARMPRGNRTRFEYRLAWARSYLKVFGLIANSERGVWTLTERGRKSTKVAPAEVIRFVRGRRDLSGVQPEETDEAPRADEGSSQAWREDLLGVLVGLRPDQFERLCQRVLRESGFTHVEVTGRSGDGGIDGVGVVRLGGLLSFPVLFQCKRYRGGIGASIVRDFRGAMVGRADRGLVLTTGAFTREARQEATRDGAPPIDLVDGEMLIGKLRELRLGVTVEQIERISVERDWFGAI